MAYMRAIPSAETRRGRRGDAPAVRALERQRGLRELGHEPAALRAVERVVEHNRAPARARVEQVQQRGRTPAQRGLPRRPRVRGRRREREHGPGLVERGEVALDEVAQLVAEQQLSDTSAQHPNSRTFRIHLVRHDLRHGAYVHLHMRVVRAGPARRLAHRPFVERDAPSRERGVWAVLRKRAGLVRGEQHEYRRREGTHARPAASEKRGARGGEQALDAHALVRSVLVDEHERAAAAPERENAGDELAVDLPEHTRGAEGAGRELAEEACARRGGRQLQGRERQRAGLVAGAAAGAGAARVSDVLARSLAD
jgi:hypothetical protein